MNRSNVKFLALALTVIIVFIMFISPLIRVIGDELIRGYLPILLHRWPPSGSLRITELLYNPAGGEPEGEWIEFYNPGIRKTDLSVHKIGDSEVIGKDEGMFRFPPGATLAPGETVIVAYHAVSFFNTYGVNPDYELRETDPFVPNMVKYTAWASGDTAFSNTGDEVLILNEDDEIIDTLAYGNSLYFFNPTVEKVPDGYSIERIPASRDTDSAEDWFAQPYPNPWIVDQSTPTPTIPAESATPTFPIPQKLLISEVDYNPPGNEPENEWFEIFNPGPDPAGIDGYKIGDEENNGGSEGMLAFPSGAWIPARGVIVIANEASAFYTRFGFWPGYEIHDTVPDVPDMIPYTDWAGISVSLNNTGDELIILDQNDNPVDALSWGDSAWAFIPPASGVPEGNSLERSPADVDTDTADDWVDNDAPAPGVVSVLTTTQTPTLTGTHTVFPSITGTTTGTATPIATLTQTPTSPITPTSTPTPTPSMTPTPTATPTVTSESTPQAARLLISEVFYDPAGSEPNEEWIELYNGGGADLNLSGYKLGDEETQGGGEGMFEFPEMAVIVSGEVVVIANRAVDFLAVFGFLPHYEVVDTESNVPDMVKYTAWSTGSLQLGNSGDEVLLLDSEDILIDTVSWGDSVWAFNPSVEDVEQGHSISRSPVYADTNSASDWIDLLNPEPGFVDPPSVTATPTLTEVPTNTVSPTVTGTSTATATQTQTGTATGTPTVTPTMLPTPSDHQLLISEVMYDPLTTEPDGEWIEIFNAGGVVVDISGYKIGDEEIQLGGEGMAEFPGGTSIAAGSVLVIANKASVFEAEYGFKPAFELVETDGEVPNLSKYSAWATGNIALSNTGDELLILDRNDMLVDALSWGSSTWAFDPAAPDISAGHTLERFPADEDSDSAADWIDQDMPDPGYVDLGMTVIERFWNWIRSEIIDT